MGSTHSSNSPEHYLKAFERTPHPSSATCSILSTIFTAYLFNKGGLTVQGEEHVPQEGPYIITPNHISHLDTAVVGKAVIDAVGHNLHFMAKREFWEGKFGWATGRFVELGGGFPIDRNNSLENQPEVLQRLDDIFITRKEPFCIYPQGTRLEANKPVGKIKGSIGYLALKYGVPIIPAGIAGTVERNHMTIVFKEALQAEPIEFDLSNPRSNTQVTPLANAFRHDLAERMQEAKSEAEALRRSLI